MSDSAVYAVFEPTEAHLLSTLPQAKLLVDNPILASALANIFPYILFIDDFLEVVTWTNDNPYKNLLLVSAYSVLWLYWSKFRLWIIPILAVLAFLSLVWTTSSVIYDSKFNEKPTVDEVLRALHNITVRFELLLRPAKHLSLQKKNYVTMAVGALLITPLHLAVMKWILLPQTYVWWIGVFVLTYHSPFAYASRRLLWRSAYVRRCTYWLTGLKIRLDRGEVSTKRAHETISRAHTPNSADVQKSLDLVPIPNKAEMVNDFTITQKTILSSTQLRQSVRFDILENERRWIGLGWSKYLLPNERSCFCYEALMAPAPDPNASRHFRFPVFADDLYTYQWQWMDEEWHLDSDFDRGKDKEGWVYYDNNWDLPRYYDGFSRYTRARKWTRRAILLIDKRSEVNDA
ncbi:hypothetical protein PUMCH_004390 [Australozyma saopauloensis]|uniref:Peroxin/Ferlin domain-containing protein n=1 Tax=Australozyma saopauloensis TaxID=291208 RepID=A0AAX4HF84_9ASCO|nr:hypothetical protein PUMCH_004390 [[Candida] saopauloensis]